MELINATRMTAGYTMGLEKSGRELLVVVIKGTFVLPGPGEPVGLHEQQLPLVMADTFSGAPGFSAPMQEIDFAPRKHFCDVLLQGSAYAPAGRQVTRTRVSLRVGSLHKACDVVGPRFWNAGVARIVPTAPQYFTRLPLSYDTAFGGADRHSPDESEHDAYLPNPVGRGWHKHMKAAWVDAQPLPYTEEIGQPVKHPSDTCRPMAFGPLARGWPQRAKYAGTYDQRWLDEDFPFLPADFDERYYQAAPEDQQIPIPNGPLDVVLEGFTPDAMRAFTLPPFDAIVQVQSHRGQRTPHRARLDTIAFDPDHERFTLTWRVSLPLHRSIFDIMRVSVGLQGHERWQPDERALVTA
jgi:hypothetical protein